MLNPCRTFFNLWKSISEKHLEYQLNIVTFEDDHRNILSTLEHLGKDFDFFVGTCSSRSWLSKCNFYPLGYHYLNVAVPYGHPLGRYMANSGSMLFISVSTLSAFIDFPITNDITLGYFAALNSILFSIKQILSSTPIIACSYPTPKVSTYTFISIPFLKVKWISSLLKTVT